MPKPRSVMLSRLVSAMCSDPRARTRKDINIKYKKQDLATLSDDLEELYEKLCKATGDDEIYEIQKELFDKRCKFSRMTGKLWVSKKYQKFSLTERYT